MFIFLIVFIGLSLLIIGHEAGHFFAAKYFRLRVDEFGFGFPPRMFAWRPFNKKSGKEGETEYSANWLPFGGFVKIAGEREDEEERGKRKEESVAGLGGMMPHSGDAQAKFFYSQPAWKRSVIVLAGVTTNFLIGWFLLWGIFMVGTPPAVIVLEVQEGSPAETSGILKGDIVQGFADAGELSAFTDAHRGEEIEITAFRGGEERTFTLAPRAETKPGEGAIGVYLGSAGLPRHGFFSAGYESLKTAGSVCVAVGATLWKLIAGLLTDASLLGGVVGPVGIFSVAQETGQVGIIYLIQLLAFISLNLAVVNLIPFPALDGGRFLMILVEKLKGSPLPKTAEGIVNVVGFAFLILLMVLLTVRDIVNL